ncbi:molybdopterin converting factor subunit 1 [Pinisolibacter aquiterrae]|jgi:molybdopterin synthase sulfur carrier subunit|uniref:molybdopterin converting factor subunit 1 n=1 Tax=Pinisolibacter aquiterrae TaxID=2815579 RepID=UPI001C3DD995|nr:molybdopterin converting factor subunit 1 [Pinisolibacter aquiterrae]MBV5263348.1 molybdopterin converting factor subunit 1 [Pinisolibacter aquiterrae]MCC8237574.1 molybdopterin converting factor subunit 1 [Pinisolibacter aquiterrae]
MKVRYFAWVRERIGKAEEILDPPAEVVTTADLLAWLKTRGPEYEWALEKSDFIRVAVDQVHASPDTPLGPAREVALFPPMTGG